MSTKKTAPKKRGRKRTDSIAVNTRLHPEEITALDAHRGEETRPQAVRKIVRERLGLIKLT